MEPWKVVIDEEAFQFPLAIFDRLKNDPRREPDYHSRDATGRTLSIMAARPFLITYWLDSFVSEIRIVNIQRIRF